MILVSLYYEVGAGVEEGEDVLMSDSKQGANNKGPEIQEFHLVWQLSPQITAEQLSTSFP